MTTTLTMPTTDRTTPTPKRHISVQQTVTQSMTMAYRGLLKFKHNPEQLFDVVFQPIIFTLMFSYIFGGAVSGDVTSYLPTIIPGILAQTVITTSIVTGTQLREDMDKGVFDRFRSLPIARISPLAGALTADVVRYFIATLITFATGFAMGYRPDGGVLGFLAAGALVIFCAWSISWIFALMGVLMNKASSVQGISMLVLFPLTFLSNAFVSVDTMPGWLQAFVNINPVSHLVTAVRDLANNGRFGVDVLWSLLGAAIIVAVIAPITVKAYMRKA
ncbi:ABC transporter permease [Rhodococcus sp. G-MC3]|uniref:ABC transporter permease n=1 Tax=Rhodococcus sp. G-MC3 TaxID=3046209 RepID=UPI0024BB4FBA|nr:ABC transporter permease [Rhodococcus sp. G-MC3]MDJ0392128.1 ABC transporter permease [Rhodococcus sp. G-MC3]